MPQRRVSVTTLPGCRNRIAAVELRRIARHVLAAEAVAAAVEVEVVLADAATVRALNRLYRGRDEETDVLSFAALSEGSHEPQAQPERSDQSEGSHELQAQPERSDQSVPSQNVGATFRSPAGATPGIHAFIDAPDAPPSLGEVIICLPVAESQARALIEAKAALGEVAAEGGRRFQISPGGFTTPGAVAHLLVHGLLHLLAYDHEEAAAAAAMQSREDDLLSALGYAGTYEHGH